MTRTASSVAEQMQARVLCMPCPEAEVSDAYAGDLLSWVMGHSHAGQAWLTIMTNINIVAVASLKELPLVILCEGTEPDADVIERAREEGINLIVSDMGAYGASVLLSSLLQ